MNFFHNLFKPKLDAMRAAAPRASVHLLHESNGFSVYLDEATAVRKITQLGTLTDHAEDILEETVPVLFIPLEQCVKFVEEVTAFHSVGLVDVILADKVNNARYVMYAYFGKKLSTFQDHVDELVAIPKFNKFSELPPWAKEVVYVEEGQPFFKRGLGDLRQRALVESIVSSVVPYDADALRARVLDSMAASLCGDPPKGVPEFPTPVTSGYIKEKDGSVSHLLVAPPEKLAEKESLDADFWG